MKLYILALLFISNTVLGQSVLKFDTRIIHAENKWVAFKPEDGSYLFCFVYIDEEAGPTMEHGGNFKIAEDGKFLPTDKLEHSIKYRLSPSNKIVAIIPDEKLSELGVKATPDWLAPYQYDTVSADHFFKRGYMYNEWGDNKAAATALEKVQQINPEYAGLKSEMAFTYNAMRQYEKAVIILKDKKKKTCYDYKELVYAFALLEKLDEAADTYKEAVRSCKDTSMLAENAYNITGTYFRLKDQPNFTKWAAETRKWCTAGDNICKNLDGLEQKMSK